MAGHIHKFKKHGFTLMELAVVLVIIGLISGVTMTLGQSTIDSVRRTQTSNKFDAIENALMAYRTANNRLPCPADATLLTTDPNYGVEANSLGNCIAGSTYNANGIRTAAAAPGPTADYFDAANNVVEGAVPFKTLKLPQEFMYDAWGRKFAYAVNSNVTGPNAMLGQAINDTCNIAINDASGNNRASQVYSTVPSTIYTASSALYTLVSYGPDGHGGYLKNGTRYSSGSTDADEQTNCHCDPNANETIYSATYVQKDMTPTFGDFVRSKDRWQMMTYDDSYKNGGTACSTGTNILGNASGDMLGEWVMMVGDVNGDGIPDLIFYSSGDSVSVVFGTKTGFPSPLPLNALNGTNGFTISGLSANGGMLADGIQVGDINGDGITDIVIGMPSIFNGGDLYAIFGHSGPWPANLNVSSLNGTNGFTIKATGMSMYYPWAGIYIADINGDGIGDIIGNDPWDNQTLVIFGKKSGWPTTPQVVTSFMDGVQGFELKGSTIQGIYWNSIVDINGDGIPDIIMNGPQCGTPPCAGETYVVFGKRTGWAPSLNVTTDLNGNNGFVINGAPGDWEEVIAAGDINGDGINDLIISTFLQPAGAGGKAYILFGRKFGWPAVFNLATPLTGINGFTLVGGPGDGLNGVMLADINGDGYQDIILDAINATYNGTGSTYVVFGHPGSWAATNSLPVIATNGTTGFRIDNTPYGPSNIYDINADGLADMIFASTGATVLYGRRSGWPGTFILPTPNGTNGFFLDASTLSGGSPGGFGACMFADFNGDGVPDLACPCPGCTAGGLADAGIITLLWGRAPNSPQPATVNAITLK